MIGFFINKAMPWGVLAGRSDFLVFCFVPKGKNSRCCTQDPVPRVRACVLLGYYVWCCRSYVCKNIIYSYILPSLSFFFLSLWWVSSDWEFVLGGEGKKKMKMGVTFFIRILRVDWLYILLFYTKYIEYNLYTTITRLVYNLLVFLLVFFVF